MSKTVEQLQADKKKLTDTIRRAMQEFVSDNPGVMLEVRGGWHYEVTSFGINRPVSLNVEVTITI